MEVFIYIISMYGLTNLLVYGDGPFHILTKMRNFFEIKFPMIGRMLDCMMCTSFNIGWMLSLVNILFMPYFMLTPFMYMLQGVTSYWYLIMLFDACFTSGAVWLLHTFQEMCEIIANNYTNKFEDKNDEDD